MVHVTAELNWMDNPNRTACYLINDKTNYHDSIIITNDNNNKKLNKHKLDLIIVCLDLKTVKTFHYDMKKINQSIKTNQIFWQNFQGENRISNILHYYFICNLVVSVKIRIDTIDCEDDGDVMRLSSIKQNEITLP
ncbi:hypothetical protein DERP_005040 [Dermatophagoides pteronyssinus]|uniref:Uncharacterized protein n=1 Tax=Dermatophagoides pteronyssinus TaxID=6956 RepID=A0ABQ8JTD1_DERPT|nr:hypothetical protein DERP_005040 [Dermatophagoides pteronyssinus]